MNNLYQHMLIFVLQGQHNQNFNMDTVMKIMV